MLSPLSTARRGHCGCFWVRTVVSRQGYKEMLILHGAADFTSVNILCAEDPE